jgi:hypothetical protein
MLTNLFLNTRFQFKRLFQTLRLRLADRLACRPAVWQGPAVDHAVIPAFRCGGVQYWQFAEPFNIPTERAFAASQVYEELEMRCTREVLEAHVAAIQTTLDAGKLARAAELNADLRQRLDWLPHPDQLYRLASVLYFDASENPYRYEATAAQRKINRWKRYPIADFFLQQPMKHWLPDFEAWGSDLQRYTTGLERQMLLHLERLLTEADNSLSPATRSALQQQAAKLRHSLRSAGLESGNSAA